MIKRLGRLKNIVNKYMADLGPDRLTIYQSDDPMYSRSKYCHSRSTSKTAPSSVGTRTSGFTPRGGKAGKFQTARNLGLAYAGRKRQRGEGVGGERRRRRTKTQK
jgi:hypothetical protein